MATPQQRRRRTNLWHRDPHCYWCSCLTILPTPDHVKIVPKNQATLDHLVSRLKGRNGKDWPNGINTVLACWQCNNDRGKVEQSHVDINILRIRAGQAERYNLDKMLFIEELYGFT